MTQAQIQPYLDADPFEPFTITMTHGGTHEVVRQDEVGFTRHGELELRYPNGDWRAILAIGHITSIVAESTPTVVGGAS